VRVRGVVANDEIGLPSDAVTVLVSEAFDVQGSAFKVQRSTFDVPPLRGTVPRGVER